MSKLNNLAEKICHRTNNSLKTIDPLTILTIISFLIALYQLYKACNKTDAKILKSMKNLGILQRRRLRKAIKEHFKVSNRDDINLIETQIQWSLTNTNDEDLLNIIKECENKG